MLKPKLHSALSMVQPVDIEPCLLGHEPPEMDEIEILPDQGQILKALKLMKRL